MRGGALSISNSLTLAPQILKYRCLYMEYRCTVKMVFENENECLSSIHTANLKNEKWWNNFNIFYSIGNLSKKLLQNNFYKSLAHIALALKYISENKDKIFLSRTVANKNLTWHEFQISQISAMFLIGREINIHTRIVYVHFLAILWLTCSVESCIRI